MVGKPRNTDSAAETAAECEPVEYDPETEVILNLMRDEIIEEELTGAYGYL